MAVPDYSRMDVSTPAERRNLAVVERLYDEVINKRDLRVADSLFSSSLLQHNPLYGEGVAGFKDYLSGFYFDQFADLRVSIEVAVAQNNRVMAFTTWTGRHVESGAELSLPVADVYRVWDGRLIEHWDMTDYTELVKYGVARPETTQPADPLDKFGTPAQLMNLGRLRQYLDDVTIADLSRAHLYVAEDFVQYTDDVDPGLAGFIACFEAFAPIAPDLEVVSTCVVAGTHHVGAIWTGYGHYPQTGDKFVLPTADVYRMDHGMLTEHWGLVDYTYPERLLGFHPKNMLRL